MTSKLKAIADNADVIVNGYAFTKSGDNIYVLNLNRPDKASLMRRTGEVLETSMDDSMVSRHTNDVISGFGSSWSSFCSGCSSALTPPRSVTSYTFSGRLATVPDITRTQAYTVDSCIAERAVTDLPEKLEPK